MAERTYMTDVYLREQDSIITSIGPGADGSTRIVELDRSIFAPEAGGQSCDTGMIGPCPVTHVREKDGRLLHTVTDPECGLRTGDRVHTSIDWERRFDNMQRHSGEHIFSGVFHSLYGGVNRGFHMGAHYMTIDISLEGAAGSVASGQRAGTEGRSGGLTWKMVKKAEYEANRIIWQDLPVQVLHFDTKAEAAEMPLRKELTIERDITVVMIGTPAAPADCVACCGTHPSSTGQVGLLKAYKVEPNKGMYRVYFEAGARAFREYEEHFDTLTALGNDLSAGPGDLMAKYAARREKQNEIHDRLRRLTHEIITREAASIKAALTGRSEGPGRSGQPGENIQNRRSGRAGQNMQNGQGGEPAGIHGATGTSLVRDYDLLSIDDLMSLGHSLEGSIPGLLCLFHRPSHTVLLFSDSAECGKLVRDNAAVFGGRGGGSRNFARAIFNKNEDAGLFADAISKLLR